MNKNRHKTFGEFLKDRDTFSSIIELSPIAEYFALPDLSDEFEFVVKSFQFNKNFTPATMLVEIQNELYYKNIEIIKLAVDINDNLDSSGSASFECKHLILQARTFFAVTIPDIAKRIRKIAKMTTKKFGDLQKSVKDISKQNNHGRLSETRRKIKRRSIIMVRTSKENWEAIKNEYDINKMTFGKKINFITDKFKRKIIFRDVEHAYVLASQGFSKPAVILAGGVIEELLKQYLKHKKMKPKNDRFVDYIQACEDNGLLKHGVSRLSDSIRDFRNLVHISKEETKQHTISKATAKGAVSSIFTIANDFQ